MREFPQSAGKQSGVALRLPPESKVSTPKRHCADVNVRPVAATGIEAKRASAAQRCQDATCVPRAARTESAENGEQKLEWFREWEDGALSFHRSNSGDGAAALDFRHRNNRRPDTN